MKINHYLVPALLLIGMSAACVKESVNSDGRDPYEEIVLPSITIKKNGISPDKGYINDEVTISGKGFAANKDKISVLFSGIKGTITAFTDTTMKVKVPELSSSGNVTVQVGQEYYFGPFFRVLGTFEMDTLFPGFRGANNMIIDMVPDGDDKYLIVGDFTNYDNKNIDGGINRVARIHKDGTLDESFHYGRGSGSNAYVVTAAVLKDPGPKKYLVAGAFGSYEGVGFVNGIARLNEGGFLETNKVVRLSGKEEVTSALVGGVSGIVLDLHVQQDRKMILMGDFRYYVKPNFKLKSASSTPNLIIDSTHLDSTQVNGLVRLHPNGELDSTFNYDLVNHRGKEGANGSINRTLLLPDGKLLMVGNFTKFNGQPVSRIVRLNTDGSIDPSFNPGSGADASIGNVTRQPDGKLLITGAFNNYNGQKALRIARLNADGSLDPTFKVEKASDGFLYSAFVMPGGEIIVSGFFKKFGDVPRNNIVVLKADGTIHPTYNTNGGITLGEYASMGGVRRIEQRPAEKAMLMVGSFTKFDYRTSNRIVRVTYK